jgi:hypothetical protein
LHHFDLILFLRAYGRDYRRQRENYQEEDDEGQPYACRSGGLGGIVDDAADLLDRVRTSLQRAVSVACLSLRTPLLVRHPRRPKVKQSYEGAEKALLPHGNGRAALKAQAAHPSVQKKKPDQCGRASFF